MFWSVSSGSDLARAKVIKNKTRSFIFFWKRNKQTNKQRIQKLIWMKWACNKFWRKYSNIHMNLWSNSGLGGFGFESSFTLLSFQARQFTRNARSYFLQIIDDFENARICERTGLARLFKLSLQRKICKNPALKRSLSQCSDLWVRMLMDSVRGLKGNKTSQTKKDFSMRLR